MGYQAKVVLVGALAVVAFDALASIASRELGFPYARASIGSYLIYFAIGYSAAHGATGAHLRAAAVAAAVAGLVDASIGWAIAWRLGPARLPEGVQLTVGRWISTAIFVVAVAAAIGALGGVAGRRSTSAVAAV